MGMKFAEMIFGKVGGIISRGVKAAEIDEDGQLILIMTDGARINLGVVVGRGVENAEIDENGHLIITYTDGEQDDVGNVQGRGIKDAYIRLDNHLILSMTDETEIDAGTVGNSGLSEEIKEIMLHLYRAAVYFEDMDDRIDRLEELFGQKVQEEVTYDLRLKLTNVTADKADGKVTEGSSLVVNLSAADGYTLDGAEISVTMGGADITDSVLNGARIEIPEVTGDIVIAATARAMGETTWTVKQNLTNLTSDKGTTATVNDGDSYASTLTPAYGYKLEGASVTVTMGGSDITASVYDNGTVTIEAVTGDVIITAAAAEKTRHTITKALTGYTINNSASTVYEGQSYSAKLSLLSGYTAEGASVRVTMGGVNITDSAYSDGVIYISAVTGNITITATAQKVVEYSVSYNLVNVTSSNKAETVLAGGSYETELTCGSGYDMYSVTVTMGGVDITASSVSGDRVTIGTVTGDITISAAAYPACAVTMSLTNCSSTNSATAVKYGSSYTTILVVNVGFQELDIVVTMGGEDITESAVVSNKITIGEVTGDIHIKAVASKIAPDYVEVGVITINCDCDVEAGYYEYGGELSGSFTPHKNYAMDNANVRIFMGSAEITGSVYDEASATFHIPVLTDNVSILAECVSEVS